MVMTYDGRRVQALEAWADASEAESSGYNTSLNRARERLGHARAHVQGHNTPSRQAVRERDDAQAQVDRLMASQYDAVERAVVPRALAERLKEWRRAHPHAEPEERERADKVGSATAERAAEKVSKLRAELEAIVEERRDVETRLRAYEEAAASIEAQLEARRESHGLGGVGARYALAGAETGRVEIPRYDRGEDALLAYAPDLIRQQLLRDLETAYERDRREPLTAAQRRDRLADLDQRYAKVEADEIAATFAALEAGAQIQFRADTNIERVIEPRGDHTRPREMFRDGLGRVRWRDDGELATEEEFAAAPASEQARFAPPRRGARANEQSLVRRLARDRASAAGG